MRTLHDRTPSLLVSPVTRHIPEFNVYFAKDASRSGCIPLELQNSEQEISVRFANVNLPYADGRPVVGGWALLNLTKNIGDSGLARTLRTDDQNFQVVIHFSKVLITNRKENSNLVTWGLGA